METCKAYRIFEEEGQSSGRLTEVAPEELGGGDLLVKPRHEPWDV